MSQNLNTFGNKLSTGQEKKQLSVGKIILILEYMYLYIFKNLNNDMSIIILITMGIQLSMISEITDLCKFMILYL